MFTTGEKSTGTAYTTTVAFLIVALVFVPAALLFIDNFGSVAIGLAMIGSLACMGMAWLSWRKSSRLTMPAIEPRPSRSR